MGQVVITDQELTRAEAFRSSRKYPLKQEVAINADAEKYFEMVQKYDLYGLKKYPLTNMILNNCTDKGLSKALDRMSGVPGNLSYADRLGHVIACIEPADPVTYHDLTSFLQELVRASSLMTSGNMPDVTKQVGGDSPCLRGVEPPTVLDKQAGIVAVQIAGDDSAVFLEEDDEYES